jgi:hypothetical protein
MPKSPHLKGGGAGGPVVASSGGGKKGGRKYKQASKATGGFGSSDEAGRIQDDTQEERLAQRLRMIDTLSSKPYPEARIDDKGTPLIDRLLNLKQAAKNAGITEKKFIEDIDDIYAAVRSNPKSDEYLADVAELEDKINSEIKHRESPEHKQSRSMFQDANKDAYRLRDDALVAALADGSEQSKKRLRMIQGLLTRGFKKSAPTVNDVQKIVLKKQGDGEEIVTEKNTVTPRPIAKVRVPKSTGEGLRYVRPGTKPTIIVNRNGKQYLGNEKDALEQEASTIGHNNVLEASSAANTAAIKDNIKPKGDAVEETNKRDKEIAASADPKAAAIAELESRIASETSKVVKEALQMRLDGLKK